MKGRILVVDDEIALQKAIVRYFKKLEYDVDAVSDGAEAIERAKNKPYDLVLTDLKMPGMTGLELLKQLKSIKPDVAVLIMTGHGTIDNAVEAIQAGAFHYITKPFELNDLGMLASKAIRYTRLSVENEQLRRQIHSKSSFDGIIGCSDSLKTTLMTIEKVLDSDSNVLILGESGTGKELVARAIHYNGRRAANPFVPINCGAIPENLLESELFGHVKGAFTGAIATRGGKFEAANGGTIFLDEIGDMSMKLQVKLLRVLQERKFEPIGSTESLEVDVRVVAATHRDLQELVDQGRFREDLYYRLNVVPVTVPPLRERVGDIPLLVEHFLEKYALANKVAKPVFAPDVMPVLVNARWPGNVRELENTIERVVVLRHGQTVTRDDVADKIPDLQNGLIGRGLLQIPDTGISLKNLVDDFENSLILKALEKAGWNKNRAAHLLRVNRTTLVEKLKKKKLEPPTKAGLRIPDLFSTS